MKKATLKIDLGFQEEMYQSTSPKCLKIWYDELAFLAKIKRSMRGIKMVINYGYFRKNK